MLTINKSAQKILSYITLGYLGIPIALFLLNWCALYISLPLIALLLAAARISCREDAENSIQNFSVSRKCLLSTVILALAWCYWSGIGGYSFQNSDFHWRNAIFQDLSNYPWPVIFSHEGTDILLVYYFTYWLPAALAAKVLGAQGGLLFLYLWTVLGVLLVVYCVSLHLRKTSIIIPVVLILFSSGCDIVPFLFKTITTHSSYRLGQCIEFLGGYQYSSITTCLYWVFNQAVPAWLGTALILNKKSIFSRFFIAALVYPFAPFAFIGLVMLIGLLYILEVVKTKRLHLFGDAKSKVEIASMIFLALVSLVVIFVVGSFFSTTGRHFVFYVFGGFDFGVASIGLPVFLLFDFAIMAVSVFLLARGDMSFFYAAAVSLLLIPLVQFVSPEDFIMRVSIPAILVMGIYACAVFMDNFEARARAVKIAFILFFAICAVTPGSEIYRSVRKTAYAKARAKSFLADDIKSLSNFYSPRDTGGMANFRSTNYQNSFYWKYLRW